jgi:hypothetical protein
MGLRPTNNSERASVWGGFFNRAVSDDYATEGLPASLLPILVVRRDEALDDFLRLEEAGQ